MRIITYMDSHPVLIDRVLSVFETWATKFIKCAYFQIYEKPKETWRKKFLKIFETYMVE